MSLTLDPEKYKISAVWQCPACGEIITVNITETFEYGWPIATDHGNPDIKMDLIHFVLEDVNGT